MLTILPTLPLLFLPALCWRLRPHGLPDHYHVSSAAVFRQRTFLALPRTSCFNGNYSAPTLLELPWSGENAHAALPRTRAWLLDAGRQTWGRCSELQNALSVGVEGKKGRLWVLDGGNGACEGKVVVYSLFFNYEVGRRVLKGAGRGLGCLVVDQERERVYAGGLEGEILVVRAGTMEWGRVRVEGGEGVVLTDSLALSRNGPTLYVTSVRSDDLYSLDTLNFEKENTTSIKATFHGRKLGPSGGLIADNKHGLIYYLRRDYAIVRWDTRKPLQAEYHRVLYQSYEYFPYVSYIFTGPQMGIWALVNPSAPMYCDANNKSGFELPNDGLQVKARVVKLLRFNQRSDQVQTL